MRTNAGLEWRGLVRVYIAVISRMLRFVHLATALFRDSVVAFLTNVQMVVSALSMEGFRMETGGASMNHQVI